MKKIKLSKGKYAVVDDSDFGWINQWKWSFSIGYASRRDEVGKTIYMHRLILNTPKGKQTDHINLNRLDNRRSNLRIATASENKANEGLRKNNTSGYKGVYWFGRDQFWIAYITVNKKPIRIGSFATAKKAAIAYDIFAKKHFGNFALTNI